MKEKFEHKLINKINEVFDSPQVEYNPQDWEKLKEKLPAKKSLVPVFWSVAKAASIILLIALGSYLLWNGLFNSEPQKIDTEHIAKISPEPQAELNKNQINNPTTDSGNFIMQEYLSEEIVTNQNPNKNDQIITEKTLEPSNQIVELAIADADQPSELNTTDLGEMDSLIISIPEGEDILADNSPQKNDSVIEPNNETLQPAVTQFEIPPEISGNESRKKQKVKLGVEFASFTNYSPENITPSMNYGGGLAAHIPIKKRFSFNPGIIVSVYNMEFSDNQNILNKPDQTFSSLDNFIENNPEARPTEINLTGLDIPINFQYQFIRRKSSDYFIELGFSSLLYLSENYSYSFVTLSNTPNPYGVFEVEETTNKEIAASGLKTFDFAKLINFSVGMDYRLNKRLDITINPYLKYPVSTLTSGDIKFGSGGLKLKFMLKPGR
ncbi:MAG: PorT family protein [Bacteroidales bacterium]|nr:PorT family protein [Bacteroidales bacterium]